MRSRTPAICLRTTDYSETSQVVTFLTRGDGVVRLIAKGTKRSKSKSGGAIDLLSTGDLLYTRKNPEALGTLLEFSERFSHLPLRRNAHKLNAAMYLLEVTGLCLPEGDPSPEVYELLVKSLRRLGEPDAPIHAVVAWFQWRLLRRIGLLGELTHCVGCGMPIEEAPRQNLYFTSRQGGLLCEGCEGAHTEKFHIDAEAFSAVLTLSAVEAGNRSHLPEPNARSANRLLSYHISQQLGKRLKMARYLLAAPPVE